jgi:formamidopyrimidine-DNA glycosylase
MRTAIVAYEYTADVPELPEVEYARRQLQRWLAGATIAHAVISDARILGAGSPRSVARALAGRRVRRVERRGKWLRLTLDRGLVFSHLGMTGKWVRGDEPPRFERARLEVVRRGRRRMVRFVDPRLFGSLTVSVEDLPAWRALGPDPLHDGVDADRLHGILQRRSGPIKPLLLDQTLLAGVGNIQAIESLFLARIDPRRAARSLSRREVGVLARSIEKSIVRTLAVQVGPKIEYVEEPGADNPFLVYGRGGNPCPRCKTKLVRIEQGGRGTVYCPRCQR